MNKIAAIQKKIYKRNGGFSFLDFIIIFFLLIISYILILQFNRPVLNSSYGSHNLPIDITKNPVQTPDLFAKDIIIISNGAKFILKPVAYYKISGIIIAKNTHFFMDYGAKISPIDVGIAWGKMAEPEYDKYMHYNSYSRILHWNYKRSFPFTYNFLNSHVSHNHIIPANKNILNAIKSCKIKEAISLEGYLVNVIHRDKRSILKWNTSISRYDTAIGACEVMYVNKIRVGDKVYQ